ncbi:MAG: NAD-dependent epimerase/dehydratase family protein [Gammaproteobacteria bacterium]|nr:NAD-dependent epimerase/dehydratase family protein [Gammaproteobacteria bacterium]
MTNIKPIQEIQPRQVQERVTVIIVNFNAGSVLTDAVVAVLNSTVPIEVIIVDNASKDNSIRYLRDMLKNDGRVRIIESNRNLGFAKAANIALENAQSDWFLVLNPDCIVNTDTIEKVMSAMADSPRTAVGGCMIRNPDGTEQAGCRRAVPTPWRSMVRVLNLDRIFSEHPRFRTFLLNHDPLPESPVCTEAVSGAFMLLRREAVEQVGLMDEGYFLHCEDLDWCMRFRALGWQILFVPGAEAIHHKGTCSKDRPIRVYYHMHRGMIRFYGKFFRHQYPAPLLSLVTAGVWLRFGVMATGASYKTARKNLRRKLRRRDVNDSTDLPSCRLPPRSRESDDQAEPVHITRIRSALVTGATGFIGQRLVNALLRQNIHVGIFVRYAKTSDLQQQWPAGQITIIPGDIEDQSSLQNICDGYDTVFHLAGYAHAEDSTSENANTIHWRTTVEGTRAILREAKRAGAAHFVFVSTVKTLGEGNIDCENESSPTYPLSGYGRAKLEAEKLVLDIQETQPMSTTVLRLPLVYGGGNKGNIPRMIAAIDRGRFPPLLKTHNQRSMVHVDDVIQALLMVADQPDTNKNVYIVTDGLVYSTSDIYKAICQALGKPLPSWSTPLWLLRACAKIGDLIGLIIGRSISLNTITLEKLLGSACYNSSKISRDLGFTPRHTLYSALSEMVADYRATRR